MKYREIIVNICVPCLEGEPSECHSPGCALWLHHIDLPIHEELYHTLREYEMDPDV